MLNGRAGRMAAILAGLCLRTAGVEAQVPDKFTNLRILSKDTSREELVKTMRSWTSALGVRCNHCHTGGSPATLEGMDFASDDKWEKRAARSMLRMLRAVNQDLATLEARPPVGAAKRPGSLRVECVTCHRSVTRPETIDGVLARVLAEEGPEAALRTYGELRTQYLGRGSYDFSDRPLNTLGERLVNEGRAREAVAILDFDVEQNPDSAWAHHLAGEARLAAGDRVRALAAFERSLALNPQNPSTRKRVEELKAAPSPAP